MIVRTEDFEVRPHALLSDPAISEEMRQELIQMGMAEPMNHVECLQIEDECFHCGEKLVTPYVYWQGDPKPLSLHPQCALKLALGLVQDACAFTTGARPISEVAAAQWLEHYAAAKLRGKTGG